MEQLRDTNGTIGSFQSRPEFDNGMERLRNIGMIAIDNETDIVSHRSQTVSRLATNAFPSLNVIRFFQYFVLEFMTGRSNHDMLSWYLGLV